MSLLFSCLAVLLCVVLAASVTSASSQDLAPTAAQ